MDALYVNIKKRRVALGMSQQELAEKVGYTGKSMISKVERGEINLPSDTVIKMAEALHTSAACLYGWLEDAGMERDTVIYADEEEAAVIEAFRQSDDTTKEMIKRILFIGGK